MKKFENHARKTLTADGLQERYVDRRVEGYDKIDPATIIDSRDISLALVDTYGMFDLTELSCGVDEGEFDYLTKDEEIKIPFDEYEGAEIEFNGVVEFMLETARLFMEAETELDLGKPLEMETISYFSPSEYNYSTDWGEYRVLKNPFDTLDELAEYLKKKFGSDDRRDVDEDLKYKMYEALNEYMYENITGYNVRHGGEYRENLSVEDLKKLYA